MSPREYEHDLFVVDTLQSVQIFDTALLPCYVRKVFEVWLYPISGIGSIDLHVVGRRSRSSGACAPDRRPRLEQVPSVLISQISGEEIANTKTWLYSAHRA